MKKLIFNGCSFMAGDELVWKQYHEECNRELLPWFSKNPLNDVGIEFRYNYIDYRKNFNLPAMVSRNLGCEWFDLSRDGKSNETIAMETIACINSIDKEERTKYHVIIGWSSLSRVMKYSKIGNHFIDLTAGHYDGSNTDPVKDSLKDYIKEVILGGDDEDHISNYISNIMLLENYLIVNNISYTFYRSLDDNIFNFKTVGPFDYKFKSTIQVNDCTNHNNWYKFVDGVLTPINSIGWGSELLNKPHMWVTPYNAHPGLKAVSNFSTRLSEFIKIQQIL